MIIDKIQNAFLYSGLGEKISKALTFLQESDFSSNEHNEQIIEGRDLYAIFLFYQTDLAKDTWEAHQRYIDIHFILEGEERIGYADLETMTVVENYDPDKDVVILKGTGDLFVLKPGMFAIFYPGDAHLPGVAVGDEPQQVRKIVVKIKV